MYSPEKLACFYPHTSNSYKIQALLDDTCSQFFILNITFVIFHKTDEHTSNRITILFWMYLSFNTVATVFDMSSTCFLHTATLSNTVILVFNSDWQLFNLFFLAHNVYFVKIWRYINRLQTHYSLDQFHGLFLRNMTTCVKLCQNINCLFCCW